MCSRVRERGEVATQRNCGAVRDLVRGSDKVAKNGQHGEDVQTSDSLGLDRRRIAEWRDLRDAGGEELAELAIDHALPEGRAPSAPTIAMS